MSSTLPHVTSTHPSDSSAALMRVRARAAPRAGLFLLLLPWPSCCPLSMACAVQWSALLVWETLSLTHMVRFIMMMMKVAIICIVDTKKQQGGSAHACVREKDSMCTHAHTHTCTHRKTAKHLL